MYISARPRSWFIFLALLALTVPAFADNVNVSGTVRFSSLDGSSLDHDGAANGVFTVSDGDLTVLGTINCNDDSTTSACSMSFAVSGNFVMQPGSAIYAENRTGGGAGGDVTVTAGGAIVMRGATSTQAGAIVSTSNHDTASGSAGGNVTLTAGAGALVESGAIVTAGAKGGAGGSIALTTEDLVEVRGLIASGPSSTLASTRYTGAILSGGSSTPSGGNITITSHSHSEPAVVVTSSATIVSQSGSGASGHVLLEGCGVTVNGLVASVSVSGPQAKVTLRSGTSILLDGRDLGATGSRQGMLRADALQQSASSYSANLFAREAVTVHGPAAGSLYAVTSNGGATSKDASGSINVISTTAGVTASGNTFAATNSDAGDQGGAVNVSAAGNVNLDTAKIDASGDDSSGNTERAGGAIHVRSYSGGVSWQNGAGDVRPVGSTSGVVASRQGTISITYCTTLSTTGTSFPANGTAAAPWPVTANACSPAAPALPAGETHPDCNDAPVVANDAYTTSEGGTLNVPAPGVLANDVDPEGNAFTAILVSGPAHASSFALNADGSFTYVHDGSENHSDSFTYRATDGHATSEPATVSIVITPVNDAPVANNDSCSVDEAGTMNYAAPGVLANDSDSDGPAASAIVVSGPAHASSFVLNADGSFVYVHDGSETTADSFTYRANDGSLDSNVATASIAITPINDAPVANNDSRSVAEGGTLNGASIVANDTDAENNTLTATVVSGPAHASSFTLNADGTFTYVHDGSETTTDSFTYKANDGSADSNVATVTISISPVNDAPVASAESYTVAEGGVLAINAPGVLGNDTDAENDSLNAVVVSGPAHASAFTLNADGSFTYTHDGSETTTDSFTYEANDGAAGSNVVTVSITITPVNDAPVANGDTRSVDEGGTLSGTSVLGNDTDAENDSLGAALVSGPAHASSFTFNADGTFTYVHDGGETTTDSFTYKANDGSLDSNVATVTITINPVNDAPVATGDSHAVAEGGTLNVAAPGVLGNDTDAENSGLAAVLVSGPARAASFTLNANGSFTYVHDGSETTTDSFTYRANDGSDDSNVVTVTIAISPVNDAPAAAADAYTVAEGATLNGSSVLANDSDAENDSLTAVLVSGPAHASSFTLNADGTFTYVHNGGETSTDSFSYKTGDGAAFSNTVTVTITITPVNDAPVANNDTRAVAEGGTLNGSSVVANDSDSDSSGLTATLVSGPAHAASFTLNADGTFTYVHDGSETTVDSFTYKSNDGSLDSNVATVSINISPVNDAPVAAGESYTAAEGALLVVNAPGVLGNDTDADGNALNAVLVSGPAHAASFTLNGNGSFSYTHNGSETTSDSFTYKAYDGAADSNLVTVTITITPVNDAPVAAGDAGNVDEGGTLNGASVLANDSDAENDSLSAVLVSGPSSASSFALNADGTFSYVHDGGQTTADSFTYKANDGSAHSNTVTVAITINPVNDVPVAAGDSHSVAEGGTLNVVSPGVLGNDSDADHNPLTAVLVSGPAHAASFTLNANGSFTYVHDGSETSTDSFTYKANDGAADSNVVTVTITITASNDAPVAAADSYSVAEAATLNGSSVLANDTDAENGALTATLVSGPAHASSFTLHADGTFTYIHNGSETTSDSFSYKANDGSASSNTVTVTIAIAAVNDAPVATGDGPYVVVSGGTLNVPAPGVLANDTDVDSASLTAVLVGAPVNAASFALNTDGSFTYVNNGTLGGDSFTYAASDGSAQSNVVTVMINVSAQPPSAANDSYTTVGNTELRVGSGSSATPHLAVSGSVLANDTDPDTPQSSLSVASYDATSMNGGSVQMSPNGTFRYYPPAGLTAPDRFNYVVTDGTSVDTATVNITFAGEVWYVRNNAGAGDGRSHAPYNSLATAASNASAGDTIYIHRGDGTGANHGAIVLLNDQRLIGEGVTLTVGSFTLHPAGARPRIAGVTLADDNTVAGMNIAAAGAGISGTGSSGGAIETVGIAGGTNGIVLANAVGLVSISNTTVNPGGIGLSITGSVSVSATNLAITTAGSTGIAGNGTGTIAFHGGSVTTTSAAAIDLSNHNLGGAGLTSVSASNAVNGIVLSNTTGIFKVAGGTAAGSGGTITGMSGRGVSATNAGGVSLTRMNINNSGQQGVLVQNTLATASSVEVLSSSLSGNFGNAVQVSSNGSGMLNVTANGNTFANNNAAVIAQVTSTGGAIVKITNNAATFNNASPYGVTRNSSGSGAVEATISNNTVGTSGVVSSGCGTGCGGVQVIALGNNTFRALVSGNTIRQVGGTGMTVRAGEGSGSLSATISGNLLEQPVGTPSPGILTQSGTLSTDTVSVCANIFNNTVSGWTTHIVVRNAHPLTTFSLPGYTGLGTDTTAVANFIKSQNTVTTVTALRKSTAPANEFSGGSPCATPAP